MITCDALVIGAGPAGLIAAEQLGRAGYRTLVAEAKPSVARKFLMAGKSGLNLTKAEPFETFVSAYGDRAEWLRPMLVEFGPDEVQQWARDFGQTLFTGSTGRVFPEVMKASPLLRAWLARLEQLNVDIRTRWRWVGWDNRVAMFETPDGPQGVQAYATVLALGGSSWARLGSDGKWAGILGETGLSLAPFLPANAAVAVQWSDHMKPFWGAPLKSVRWTAGELMSRGEAIISSRGLEGGGMYPLTPALRNGSELAVDLVPDINANAMTKKLAKKGSKLRLSRWLKKDLRLPSEKVALFFEMTKSSSLLRENWVETVKYLPIRHAGLRPMDEAISTAGGVPRSEMETGLMLKASPGVFCAGEMLDWEAPTGGYLLTGCLATGRLAGRSAAAWIDQVRPG
ncbi:TIGR03862 family flavoprotein [Primorskyibacter sp. S87]|uniref:TIGR03862 family flavoprotein n=1 Tax=Primorskyibacter sp. S87 TaxID=3415126 RepID=UPI003C7A7E7F